MTFAFLLALPLRHSRHHHHRFLSSSSISSSFSPCYKFRSLFPRNHFSSSSSTTMTTTQPNPLPLPPISTSDVPSVAGVSPIYAQCMLRINDPVASRKFYHDILGMTELTRFDFPAFKFSLFFFAYTRATPPPMTEPQSKRASWLWARPEPTIELTWNWTSDTYEQSIKDLEQLTKPDEIYVSGNDSDKPKGFGYVQISVSNVSNALNLLLKQYSVPVLQQVMNVPTTTSTADRMYDAVIKDPDGYHVRLVGPNTSTGTDDDNDTSLAKYDPVFSSVMIRVKDPRTAIPFFARLGFSLVSRVDRTEQQESDYFLAVVSKEKDNYGDLTWACTKLRACTITLRHKWGVEEQADDENVQPLYTNGNVKPFRGFGHVGVIVDDIYKTTDNMVEFGYGVARKPSPFTDVGEIAFVKEPSTDYWVELIKRAGDAPAVPYEQPVF